MGRFGWTEILLLLAAALLLFGARRLPEIAKSFGQSIQEFKKGLHQVQRDVQSPDAPSSDKPS